MPRFEQYVSATFTIEVDAEDVYEADKLIREMDRPTFLKHAALEEVHNYHTDELPQEI